MWQSLYADLKDSGFVVVAVAMDVADAARPWIEAAKPDYPCLIDRDHHVADLYNMVNVPQAVWIDERGASSGRRRMPAPPTRSAAWTASRADDGRAAGGAGTHQVDLRRCRARLGVERASEQFVYDAAQVRARLHLPDTAIAEAHAHFRLAQYLLRQGKRDEALAHFSEASRLHPESWTIWRQAAEKDATGLASVPSSGPASTRWETAPTHRPIDMKGL